MLCGLRWEMGSLNSNLTFSRNSWLFLRFFLFFIFLGDVHSPLHAHIFIFTYVHSLLSLPEKFSFSILCIQQQIFFASLLFFMLYYVQAFFLTQEDFIRLLEGALFCYNCFLRQIEGTLFVHSNIYWRAGVVRATLKCIQEI